jgi:hypothetical protein
VAYIRSKRSNAVYGAGGDTNYTISYNVRNGAVHTAVDTVEHAARRYTYLLNTIADHTKMVCHAALYYCVLLCCQQVIAYVSSNARQ